MWSFFPNYIIHNSHASIWVWIVSQYWEQIRLYILNLRFNARELLSISPRPLRYKHFDMRLSAIDLHDFSGNDKLSFLINHVRIHYNTDALNKDKDTTIYIFIQKKVYGEFKVSLHSSLV